MKIHNIKMSNNDNIIVWQNENSFWQFCTGAEKRLTTNLIGGYDYSPCGRLSKYDQELESEINFEFADIDTKVINAFDVELKITEGLFIDSLIESGEYTGELFAENDLYMHEQDNDLRVEFYTKITTCGIIPHDYKKNTMILNKATAEQINQKMQGLAVGNSKIINDLTISIISKNRFGYVVSIVKDETEFLLLRGKCGNFIPYAQIQGSEVINAMKISNDFMRTCGKMQNAIYKAFCIFLK